MFSIHDSLFLKALQCLNTSRAPIWLMRQSGRHLASYRKLRERYSFLKICYEPELITEATLLPLRRYPLDAAIVFSDILLIVRAMGFNLSFDEGKGPLIHPTINETKDILTIPTIPNLQSLEPLKKGIQNILNEIKIPLIGFCGAPFTLASYLIEGKTSQTFKKTKQFMLSHPGAFQELLKKITDWLLELLKLQVKAGVHVVQIFDSWSYTLSESLFRTFCLPHIDCLVKYLRTLDMPTIIFCRGSSSFIADLIPLQPQALSIDWSLSLKQARHIAPSVALQGNIDPSFLYAPLSVIRQEANTILDQMQGDSGFIFNLGHGIKPDTEELAVQTLVETVLNR